MEPARKYEFVREIASGGMGSVALAIRKEGHFRRVYALKRLRAAYRDDAKVRSMFLEEARIAGLLHHPNVVSVVDVGDDSEGPYLVMDYVQGVSLADLVGYARDNDELIPVQLCVRIIKQVAEGLHAAHELSGHDGEPLDLVHRDVSPQNVLIGYDGVARLTDFGIAKAAGGSDQTATGILKGKYGYMAPEQLRFEKPTRRSDLFSLGVVLYEMLAALRLYKGEDQSEVALSILNDPPPDIDEVRSDVHPSLVELLYDLLVKDPEQRPATAAEVGHRLDAILADLVLSEDPVSVGPYVVSRFEGRRAEQQAEIDELTASFALGRLSSAPPRRSFRPAMSLTLLVMAVAAAALLWMTRPEPDESERTTLAETGTETETETGTVAVTGTETGTVAVTGTETGTVSETETVSEPVRSKRGRRKRVEQPAPSTASSDRRKDEYMDWSR